MKYRPEVDGLRAIAVVSVVIYHANAALFPGGYLGVDVFFVISGFLITQVIIGDLKADKFTFANFYERRVRRILPALYLVLFATIPFAAMWMLPSQKEDFAQSVLATTLFSSNFLFWMETGYFMAAAELKPLLHTWSLAVEEQFYFLYPLLIVGLWRFSRRMMLPILVVILVASLLATVVMAEQAPGANFYLLTTRAWELLAGAVVALTAWRPAKGAGWMAAVGLVAILVSFVLIDTSTPIPSFYGVPLVLGTQLLLIAATDKTHVGRWLAWRPLVGIGLISYSTYLWHLPLFTFARLHSLGQPEPALLAFLAVASFALAYLSYLLVEKPFRQRGDTARIKRPQLLWILSFAASLLIIYGVMFGLLGAKITFSRFPESTASLDARIEAKLATNYGLHEDCEGTFTLSENCQTSDTPEIMLWGDSFAMHLAPALADGAGWHGLIQHTKSVCVPIVGISVVTPEYPAEWADGCIAFNDQVIDWLGTQDSVRYVVISSPLGIVFNDVYMRDGTVVSQDQPELVRQQLMATQRVIEGMGKSLIIVSPPPVTGADLGQCLAASMMQGKPAETCDFTRDDIHSLSVLVYDFLHELADRIPVLFLDDLICGANICDTMVGDTFIYRDAGHLSNEGSRYLGENKDMFGLIEQLAQ